MTPYREKKQGTASSGFPHPDPLEVTRTTSNDSMSLVPDSPSSSKLSATSAVLECDYDTNPTVLYQAIEAKQWDYAISLFTNESNIAKIDNKEEKEASATWVVRKESNGKLRWRLLPLHAAIIFGSPLKLVELLLADYPLAAQCKDDRGMLPLHLAFRCQVSFDVIDELLTTYPLAVFVSERKGRIPLQCVSKSMPPKSTNNQNTIQEADSTLQPLQDGSSFPMVTGVLELYSQIVVSGERKRVEQETRTLAQTSISQMQDSHHQQLEAMRKKMENDKTEAKHQREQLKTENSKLRDRLERLEQELAERDQSHLDMTKKLRLTNVKLDLATERAEANAHIPGSPHAQHQNNTKHKSVDKMLRMMAETMVRQQKAYHGRVQKLLANYQELVTEREAMKSIFLKDSTANQQKEAIMLESFRNWFREEEKKLMLQERSLLLPSSPSASIDCRTDFLKEKVDRIRTTNTTKEKTVPDSVRRISRVPLSGGDKQQRPSQTTEPREAPA